MLFRCLRFGHPQHLHGRKNDIVDYLFVRVQVEMLEDHPDIPPKCIDVDLSVMRLDAIHDKLAIRNAFEPIDAPRQLCFYRSRKVQR